MSKPQEKIDPEAYNRAIRELTNLTLRMRRLDKAKDEFISIASHELRNPMAIIKGTIHAILTGDDGEINEEVKEDLTDLMVVVERQIRLVNELLDVSRIEAGVIYFNIVKELDIVSIAKILAETLNASATEEMVKISVEETTDLPKVQGDQDKISQVLINLVTNSRKFTKQGSVSISFAQKDDLVLTYVTDTGSGITKEKKDQLFQKFTKPGDPTVGTMSAGSGLGLYISKKYVEHHGGELWLEKSEEGVGSTFAFSLPVSGSAKANKIMEEIEAMKSIKEKGGHK